MIWPLPSIPAVYLYGAAFVAGLAAGAYGVHTWHKAQAVDAINKARKDERGFQRQANQADVRYVDRLHEQAARAERNAANFRRVLDEKNRELATCRVDAELLRVLDDARSMPGTAGHPAEPRPPAARAEAPRDGNCARELETCRANYTDVCVPNAVQVIELRAFTRKLIEDYRRATGTQ